MMKLENSLRNTSRTIAATLIWSACNYAGTNVGLSHLDSRVQGRDTAAVVYCQGIAPLAIPWNAASAIAYDHHLRTTYGTDYVTECQRLKTTLSARKP